MTCLFSRLALAGSLGLAVAPTAYAQIDPQCGQKTEADAGLLGDWGGGRQALMDAGIVLGLADHNEFWANMRGGARRGASYVGQTMMGMTIDPAKAADPGKAIGWTGMCVSVSAYQIRGRGPTPNMVGALQAVSNLEATRAIRLFDLWLQQDLTNGISVRLGQGGANSEFMLSQYGALFVNSSFGFPVLGALDLPSGAPNYPLATPFVRLKWVASETFTVLGAVFNGDPAGAGIGDPQLRNRAGTAFRTGDGVFAVMEAQVNIKLPGPSGELPGTYKLGGWVHNGRFDDQAYDRGGHSLAAPWSSGEPRRHQGNHGIYGGFDQLVWRADGETKEGDAPRGIGVFAMFTGVPGDRNLIDFSAIGGAHVQGPFAERGEDRLGFGIAYAHVSSRAQRFGRDAVIFTGTGRPFRATEIVLEATYAAKINEWWAVQPSLQYVIHPGAGIPSATSPARRGLPDAVVFGMRSSITF